MKQDENPDDEKILINLPKRVKSYDRHLNEIVGGESESEEDEEGYGLAASLLKNRKQKEAEQQQMRRLLQLQYGSSKPSSSQRTTVGDNSKIFKQRAYKVLQQESQQSRKKQREKRQELRKRWNQGYKQTDEYVKGGGKLFTKDPKTGRNRAVIFSVPPKKTNEQKKQ
jgi:hypothetical protein